MSNYTAQSVIPLYDRVLLRRLEAEKQTRGGIILPDNAQKESDKGEVIAVGNGTIDQNGNLVKLSVQPGDIVLFPQWGGSKISLDNDRDLVIVKESDILARLSAK